MNPNKYREEWLRVRARYERRGMAVFRKGLRKAAMRVPWDNIDPYHYKISIDFNLTADAIIEAYKDFYVEIGLAHGRKVGKAINKEIRKNFDPIGFAEVYPEVVLEFLRTQAGIHITTVREGLRDYLVKFIADRLEEGMASREIARQIQKHILTRGFYRWQIERIVRTETTAAANFGAINAGRGTGLVMDKMWISATDNRTRRLPRDRFDHTEMHLQKVGENEKFLVPGRPAPELVDFPGDPKASAANRINCRCSCPVVPRRDENGRLMFL